MSKVIVHIDLNAFFVRCEEIKDPTLIGKPVAVVGDGRGGIVSTCSYKAREFGVRSGMPMFQAKKLCPFLIIKPVDFRFYHTLSREFFKFVKSYTPLVEIASIDECFADFTLPLKGIRDVETYFLDFQKKLFEKTQLKCSIGVGTTKFIAKMASDYKKPEGLTIIRNREIAKYLYPLKVSDLFGIGKKTFPRLNSVGVYTIEDLAKRIDCNDEDCENILGKFFYVIKDWLEGKGDDQIINEPDDPKSIGNSSTFDHDTSNFDEIKFMFENLSKEVSSRAIRESKLGTTIQIVVKESNFQTHNKSITFEKPINTWKEIYNHAINLYEKHFYDLTVRLVGVTLQNLISNKDISIQMSLFDYEKHEEESATKLLINELNRRLSKPALKRASEVERKQKDEVK
jgi:DNA polymerase-4